MNFKHILFLITLSGTVFSQNYLPVRLDSNYVWIQNVSANGGSNSCSHTVQMKVSRTKSFNNISYQFISQFGNTVSTGNTNDCALNTKSSGFVTQDTLQQKLWLYDSIQNVEKLLYDFSQNVGDTAKHVYWFSPSQCAIVSGTSSVVLQDGLNHKVITYTVSNVMSFAVSSAIEGVGYSAGFFDPWYSVQNPFYKALNCYGKMIGTMQSIQSIYGSNCSLISDVRENKIVTIIVYPNPTRDQLVINTDEEMFVQLKDQLGFVVAELVLTGKVKEFNLESVPSGFYFLHYTGRLQGVVKIVKQ